MNDRLIFAIDPGATESGWVLYAKGRVLKCGISQNADMLNLVYEVGVFNDEHGIGPLLAVEKIAGMGMAVGQEVFDTCIWIGRFQEAWHDPEAVVFVKRADVKLHLCGQSKAKDANVRQALLDMWPRTGGGATPQVGTPKKPGPLFGMASHMWPALGVAVTAMHRIDNPPVLAKRRRKRAVLKT